MDLFVCYFLFCFILTSTDNERVLSEGKSSSAVSEPAGVCPPTSGCLMADQMKDGCMELEGGSEAGNSLHGTLTLCAYAENGPDFADCSCCTIDHCSFVCSKLEGGMWWIFVYYVCAIYAY